MKDTAWINEVLQDMAAFAVENDLPKTYDALTKAMVVTTIETQQHKHLPQGTSNNVIAMFKLGNVKVAQP